MTLDFFGSSGATFSPCRTWRYSLTRRWDGGPAMLVIGLNPSTADETTDDATIRRCIGFARREGCGALTMANLFAFRAKEPADMKAASDPVGPENDEWLRSLATSHEIRVAAWGIHGAHLGRAAAVIAAGTLGDLRCFGTTLAGHPLHPLYLRSDTRLVPLPKPKPKPDREPVRDMTPLDRRRLLMVDDGLHDSGVTVREPAPATDKFGKPLPVIQRDEHRGLLHNDGKGEPRPSKAWEETNAVLAAQGWKGTREDLSRQLRVRREALPLTDRLAAVLTHLGGLQSPRALQTRATDARSAADSTQTAPSGGRHEDVAHADPTEVDRRLRQIGAHIEALEWLVDEHQGLAHRSFALMLGPDKDAVLTGPRYRGLSPAEIHALHPELGSVRTIRQVRSDAGQRADGEPKPEREKAA